MVDKNKHSGDVLTSSNGFDIIECNDCGFKHIDPIPTDAELEQIYKHEYYIKDKPDYIEKDIKDRGWWEMTYGHRFDVFESNLATEKRKLLDIGSGPGLFMEVGNQRKWSTTGIEPNVKAAEHSVERGLDVKNWMYDSDTSKKLGEFDVINLSLVLEHIAQPEDMIRLAKNQLSDNGLICIVVPNDFNPLQQILKSAFDYKPWWVSPPHHINYFDFNSLSKLLKKCGFEIVHKESTFPIELFLLMGDNYVGNDELGRACHEKRVNFEMALNQGNSNELLNELYASFSDLNIGREVVIYGSKKTNL